MNTLDKLINWCYESPIYENGAYLSHYSSFGRGSIYPEITAYAISLFSLLYRRKKESRFLERAKTCAEYMTRISRNGGVPSFSDNLLYAFDTGIYISAMFDLYNITSDKTLLKEAKKSLNWLDTLWEMKLSAVDKVPEKTAWYHLPSVHLAKMVIPLLKASISLKDSKYEERALEILGKYGKLQMEDGGFKVNDGSAEVMTHPHCYATEGFLYAYSVLGRSELLENVKKGSDWLVKTQNSDGSLYRYYYPESTVDEVKRQERLKTADATAQATRIWKLLGVNKKGVEKAYTYLDAQLNGGLRLFKDESLSGKLLSRFGAIYSWPTFFYLHSLMLPFGDIKYCGELF